MSCDGKIRKHRIQSYKFSARKCPFGAKLINFSEFASRALIHEHQFSTTRPNFAKFSKISTLNVTCTKLGLSTLFFKCKFPDPDPERKHLGPATEVSNIHQQNSNFCMRYIFQLNLSFRISNNISL